MDMRECIFPQSSEATQEVIYSKERKKMHNETTTLQVEEKLST
jgi:hypothetical protein